MKYILPIIAILVLLVACAPEAPPTPAAQPAEVLEPQMPEPMAEPAEEPAAEPMAEPSEEPMSDGATLHEVEIKSFRYNPSLLTIKVGDTVRWTNKDRARHDAYGDGWSTVLLSQGESAEYTFTEPGVYEYICSVHPSMHGKVIVK